MCVCITEEEQSSWIFFHTKNLCVCVYYRRRTKLMDLFSYQKLVCLCVCVCVYYRRRTKLMDLFSCQKLKKQPTHFQKQHITSKRKDFELKINSKIQKSPQPHHQNTFLFQTKHTNILHRN